MVWKPEHIHFQFLISNSLLQLIIALIIPHFFLIHKLNPASIQKEGCDLISGETLKSIRQDRVEDLSFV